MNVKVFDLFKLMLTLIFRFAYQKLHRSSLHPSVLRLFSFHRVNRLSSFMNMRSVLVRVDGMTCQSCVDTIEKTMRKDEAVMFVQVRWFAHYVILAHFLPARTCTSKSAFNRHPLLHCALNCCSAAEGKPFSGHRNNLWQTMPRIFVVNRKNDPSRSCASSRVISILTCPGNRRISANDPCSASAYLRSRELFVSYLSCFPWNSELRLSENVFRWLLVLKGFEGEGCILWKRNENKKNKNFLRFACPSCTQLHRKNW